MTKTGQQYIDDLLARGQAVACRRVSSRSDRDDIVDRQDLIETGSQDTGAADEWA